MQLQLIFIADFSDTFNLANIITATSSAVRSIFQTYQGGVRLMYILRINSRQNLGCGYPPEIAREQLYRSTRIEGNTTSFILVDMSSGFTNHFISRMSMRLNSNLVRHCTRGGIQGTLHSKQSSCL